MRALLKNYKDEQFVYVNVTYEDNRFYTAEGERLMETNIVDVARDNRNKYVKCSACGELVKNTPESIAAHKEERAKQKNCLKCPYVREGYGKGTVKTSYAEDPNNPGKYIVKKKYSVGLCCGANYRQPTINTQEADDYCTYYACQNADMIEISDNFTKYPNMFEVLPTVDMLIQKRWKFEMLADKYMIYHHPTMTTLKAFVNSKGIVYHFNIGGFYAMYSKKYDKLFYCGGDKYSTRFPYNLNDSKKVSAAAKIKELF